MKLLLTLALSGSVAAFSQAGLFDLTSSFPDVTGTNPNGPWSYRSATPARIRRSSSQWFPTA